MKGKTIKTDSFTFTYHENKGVNRMIGEYRIKSNIPVDLDYGCLEECEGDGTWNYRVVNTRLCLDNLSEIIDVIKQLNNVTFPLKEWNRQFNKGMKYGKKMTSILK